MNGKAAAGEPSINATRLPYAQIREFAGRVLQAQGAPRTTVGKGWINNLANRRQDLSTRRLLFRKVEKAFDEKDFELARLQQENEVLRAKLEATTKTKKKKVVPDPNT